MIRIVLSRAALFPWLGLALLGAGAASPEGSVAGLVLVIVGANVAFYSLRDFSRHFAWGADARPMLALCGLAFLLGLGLAACAARSDALNRWLALLCAGVYLGLFAVWTAQQPVGWPYRALAFAGALLMLLGGIFGHPGWRHWRLLAECEAAPREIALADLLRNGPAGNRYVRLKEFHFCDRHAAEPGERNSKSHDLWFPVVPVDGQGVPTSHAFAHEPAVVRQGAGWPDAGGGARGPPPAARSTCSTPAALEGCLVSENNAVAGTTGVLSAGAAATVRLSNVTVVNNSVGLSSVNGGKIVSFGNNRVAGNATDGAPTQTLPLT